MRQRDRTCALCICVLVLLSVAMAAAGAGQSFCDIGHAFELWFSKDTILKVGTGFGLGLAAALAGNGLQSAALNKGEETAQQQQSPASGQREVFMDSGSVDLPDASKGTLGTVHHAGGRKNQQDTFGISLTSMGLLAVVSDGMGGMSEGEKMSQRAVTGMIQSARRAAVQSEQNPLYEMLSETNERILNLLDPDQLCRSGATLLAVLLDKGRFHWVSVGDSRIYLYCGGHLLQINREHVYRHRLIEEAVNKNMDFSEVYTDPQKDRLTSFLGMGELRHIDGSLRPVEVRRGDKLLLMSDGIFHTITEREIVRILESTANACEAAAWMERQVLAAKSPKQDNFTCVLLDI